jgi:CRP-like cAMP-binding protein
VFILLIFKYFVVVFTDLRFQIYFLSSGAVEIVALSAAASSSITTVSSANALDVVRVHKVTRGGVFGESDFFLARCHSVRAYSTSLTQCFSLNRKRFAEMEREKPQLCMLIQHTLLKSLSIASTVAMYALHPTAACSANDF